MEYLNDNSDYEEIDKNKNFITSNLTKENLISIEFNDLDDAKISDNIIKIDKLQTKLHNVDYTNLIKKYKTSIELKPYEQIISFVEYINLKKYVTIYSPLIFKNLTHRKIILIFKRKNLPDYKILLDINQNCGVPFEYMDGEVLFNTQISQENQMVYDLKTFLNPKFNKLEFKLDGIFLTLSTNNTSDNHILHSITISTAFSIRNCLPFDLDLEIVYGREFKNFFIPKSEILNLECFSAEDNIFANARTLNLKNKNEYVKLFNFKEFSEQLEKTYKKLVYNRFSIRSEFILYDENNYPLKLFITIEDNFFTKNIVIYSNAVIINHTMLNLKLHYLIGKKLTEIPGQGNYICENKNIFLISDEKLLLFEVLDNEGKTINCLSEPISLNTIGLITTIECKKNKELIYEFIEDSHLSLVSKDLEIYTNIIRILPKFIIVNDLMVDIYICLSNGYFSNKTSPDLIKTKEKKPFNFYGFGSNSQIAFRPIEDDINKTYQSGSKWNWSSILNLVTSNYMTLQIPGINPLENKYINLEKKIIESVSYIVLSETNFKNCQFLIENKCTNKSFKIFQSSYESLSEFINSKSKKIFSWANYNHKLYLNIDCYNTADIESLKNEFLFSDTHKINNNNQNKNENNISKLFLIRKEYEIKDEGVLILKDQNLLKIDYTFTGNNSLNKYPFEQIINYEISNPQNNNKNNIITLESTCFIITITTDGYKKIIKFSDQIQKKEINSNRSSTFINSNFALNLNDKNKIFKKTEFILTIKKLGISIVSDNRFIKSSGRSYNRFEILYLILKDIEFYYGNDNFDNMIISNEMQLKVKYAEFDNQYSSFTKYPIILRPNLPFIPEEKKDEVKLPAFFNLTTASRKNKDDTSNFTEITTFTYLIQSFSLSIDSEVMEAILNFISNITMDLNTSLTVINPIFESYKINSEKGIIIKKDFYDLNHYYNSMFIPTNEIKYFIRYLQTSSIEMKLSFNTQSKSKFFQKYVTSNPFLSGILSTLSSIEKADILLNSFEMHNIYGSMGNITNLVIMQYNQAMLSKIFRLFGAADFLGNPSNLVKNIGTGFKDFFQKPIEGVIRGPLEGVKGAIDGSMSLVKHAVDGTFSATSKIAGGISKGILYISQDEKYINDMEKKKITERPTNFIEGFGYGISSMASGVCAGVKDVFVKPVEGAQKDNISGFGKGILQGFGGLVSKPISGFFDLVSKTSEGIKNTIAQDDSELKVERKPRAFYGIHKYVNKFFTLYFC